MTELGKIRGMGVCSAVLICAPPYIPLVKDPAQANPEWKCPGGKMMWRDVENVTGDLTDDEDLILCECGIEDSETFFSALNCAIREIKEESGIKLFPEELILLYVENRGNHWYFFFGAKIEDVRKRGFDPKKRGNEGEIRALFDQKDPRENIFTMMEFFERQREILRRPEVAARIESLMSS